LHQEYQELQDGRVLIDAAFKADSPRETPASANSGPSTRPSSTSASGAGWSSAMTWPARRSPTPLCSGTPPPPPRPALAAAGYVRNKPSVGFGAQMMEAAPPEHTRLRRLASAAFTPRRTAELAPRIEQITQDPIDVLPPAGEVDLVEAFNAPLPATVMAGLLGIPEEHHLDFRRWWPRRYGSRPPKHPGGAERPARPAGRPCRGQTPQPGGRPAVRPGRRARRG
jgi:hypothetical protein